MEVRVKPANAWRFLCAFAWAVKALQLETRELRWTNEELAWPEKVLRGDRVKISGASRIMQDRFALVFQDFFRDLSGEDYLRVREEIKSQIFSEWKEWGH